VAGGAGDRAGGQVDAEAVLAEHTGRLLPTPEATFGGALRSVAGVTALAKQLHPEAS
jgi:hypothetical protein